jgi:ribosomal 50S subunit-recycling heat shock protein
MNATRSPNTETLHFNSHVSNVRLDKYLTEVLPQFSRAYSQTLIKQGHVLVNGQTAKARNYTRATG